MPLSKKDLYANLPGLGDNTKILVKAGGKLYQIDRADLEGGDFVLFANKDEYSASGTDLTQQEAGAIHPDVDSVLNNTSGVSFAASGSNVGIDQAGNEVKVASATENGPNVNPSGQENKGTEQGSGAIATQGKPGDDTAGAALPVTPQPDAGKSSSEGKGSASGTSTASGNSPAKK